MTSVLERIDEALTYYSAGLGVEVTVTPERGDLVSALADFMAEVGPALTPWQVEVLRRALGQVHFDEYEPGPARIEKVLTEADRICARLSRMHSAYPRKWRKR